MQDKELYEHLLGIKTPWGVKRIDLNLAEKRVNVWVGHGEGIRWPCPDCKTNLPTYDHAEERAWRHLDSCAFQTYLHARIPRVECPEHAIAQVRVPWAEPHSRFTVLFERLAIDVLLQCDVTGATRILNISWKEAWHLMERAVARGQKRKAKQVVRRIGVDEKAVAKGHKYMTIVCNLDGGTVEYITEDRKQESLESYYKGLTPRQKEGIEAVAMDMWEPYAQATAAHLEKAEEKIVFDRFHIMKHMGEAVDMVRKQENRELLKDGDETLKGSKYLWLYSQENMPDDHREKFAQLKAQNLKSARAWAIKESLRGLWHYFYLQRARNFWKRWHFWATHSRLEPVREVAALIKRHLTNILTYCRHRITNAMSEGINAKIQAIKKMAYGFRNRENFKTAIYFHCGGLNLYPC
jgi:transposase